MNASQYPNQTYWQSLATAADHGPLFLDQEAATQCHEACSTYLAQLRDRQNQAREMADISGWGEFDSGKEIRRIYAEKAVGGKNNMVDVLQSHIDVVMEMQTVFAKFFATTQQIDDDSSAGISQNGPN